MYVYGINCGRRIEYDFHVYLDFFLFCFTSEIIRNCFPEIVVDFL